MRNLVNQLRRDETSGTLIDWDETLAMAREAAGGLSPRCRKKGQNPCSGEPLSRFRPEIVVIFTSYTAILGRNLLALDIGTFVVAILVGQLLCAWLLTLQAGWRRTILWPGLALLALQLVAYSLFTFFPPDHWLFFEARSGVRGIPVP